MTEDLKKLSLEELKKKEKQLKGITAFLIGIAAVGFVASAYLSITTRKFSGGIVIALGMTALLFTNFKNIKKIQEEISSRSV